MLVFFYMATHASSHGRTVTKWALVFGLAIVLNLFFNYALSLAYPEPVWDEYVGREYIPADYYDEASCIDVGGKWYPPVKVPPERMSSSIMAPEATGWCDPNYAAQMEYDAVRKTYERNAFLILVVLGAISIGAGVLVPLEVLALGFSWGGVLSLVVGSLRYWNEADTLVKVLILLAALLGLVFVAVRKFKDN